jgi:hypothetical protein
MTDTRPPSYKRFIELEDWYLSNRDNWPDPDKCPNFKQEEERLASQLEHNLQERQIALWQCLKEIKDSEGAYSVPLRLISTLCYAMEDLITRGEANDYLRPSLRDKHKQKYHPIVRMAIEHAVKYVSHHQKNVPGFNRPNYWQDIVITYEVNEKTVRTWAEKPEYRDSSISAIPWTDLKTAMTAIEFWGEVYRSGGKASSNRAALKKSRKAAGK